MRSLPAIALLFGVVVAACAAPAPPRPPVAPPEQILRYAIFILGKPAGESEVRIAADGTRRSHVVFNVRGWGPDVTTEQRLDARGAPRWFRATGTGAGKEPVSEQLDERAGQLVWSSSDDHGQAPAGAGFYLASSDQLGAALTRALLRAPGRRLRLLPTGEAWIEAVHDLEIDHHRLRQVATAGLDFGPHLVWLDDHGELFASVSTSISIVRADATASLPALRAADQAWHAARAARLAGTLAHPPPAAGLAITHARVFDSARRTVADDQTVIVTGDRITAVGGAATPIPAGARVIDAHGRMILPGLWNMHVHVNDHDGVLALAQGITTVRDLGNQTDELAARIARIAAGTELGPTILRAGFIDGTGKAAAVTGVQVDTPAQARAAVERYADLGFVQIKIYNAVKPALVPILAAAAHARGLRVSGHVPLGMNAAQAVEAGFDELQHLHFLVLQLLVPPDDATPTQQRYLRVAEGAAALDLDGPEARAFLDLLAAHHTVIDPTAAIFEDDFTLDAGQLSPIYAPFAGRLPAQVERGIRSGGREAGGKRATFRASYAAMLQLVKRAHDRGIAIVPGTDAGGLVYPRELELYVQAGIPAPDVLALATLGAARVMALDREAGSITAGKRGDLVLINGDPTRDISAIRNADLVVCRGVVYDPDELFASVGIAPRPRSGVRGAR